MSESVLEDLALAFVPLSFATIGGGQSAVADIHRQVVDVHHWMSETQFLDDFAIARMAPGPGSLFVTLLGWHIDGLLGALVASMSIFLPTAFLVYGVAMMWRRYSGARILKAMETGLRPIAAGMILAAVYVLLLALGGGWIARAISFVSTLILLRSRVNPLILIGSGAAVFMGLHQISVM